jgi:superfamily II DNA or RNA helicase
MIVFENWAGNITLPPLLFHKQKVGNNNLNHSSTLPFVISAILLDTQIEGYWLLTTNAAPPFDKLYIRQRGTERKQLDRAVLILKAILPINKWSTSTEFEWDDSTFALSYFNTPEQITKSWQDAFRFRVADLINNTSGLRKPQIGAVHAIAAYFALRNDLEAATVVLPTGTGKTDAMIAAFLHQRPSRLLVLVPSDILRKQVAEKFETLGLLREIGCVPLNTCPPRVARLTNGVKTLAEAKQIIKNANVIVALPDTLAASVGTAIEYIYQECSMLFVDEAHHLAAKTWQKVRNGFVNKPVVQFTATPFRNDQQHMGGQIIFNYKLSDAQKDGYYKSIRLYTIEEFGGQEIRDRAIAKQAIAILREDRKKYQHLLMARAQNKTKADQLLLLYRELAIDLNPVVIYSGPGLKRKNDVALKALQDKSVHGSKIVICVDMLGEGFDLPELKIAAIHDNHKSLAVTLQFVGRFTRSAESVDDAAVVINIADPNAEKRIQELYSEGADWDNLISRLSETQIASELSLQEAIKNLKSGGNLHNQISLWNLHPKFSVQVYRTNVSNWTPQDFAKSFSKKAKLWHSVGNNPHILIVVAQQEFEVDWGKYENLVEVTYDMMIAYWDQINNSLFIYASDYDRMRVSEIAKNLTSQETELLNGPRVFNVLNNVELPLAKSLGSSRYGAISFTSYFGPNVTEGLASIEKSESELNYIGCLGYENGNKVLWGAAQRKAKIWQRKRGSLDEWMNWCREIYTKLMSEHEDSSNITRDFLRPVKLPAPYKEFPISVQWGEYLQSSFSDQLSAIFGTVEIPLHFADCEIVSADENEIQIAIYTEEYHSIYSLRISALLPKGYSYTLLAGPDVSFRIRRGTIRNFQEQMYTDPLVVRYADGTFSYNNFHIPFDLKAGSYSLDQIEVWNWEGIPLNHESIGINKNTSTIQYRTYENVAEEFDLIINDDGPGEAGDLVCLKDLGSQGVSLCLIHCKNAIGGKVSGDIRNLYTVCGQAQKSIVAKHEGLRNLASTLRRRNENWVKRGSSRFLKGDLKTLSYFVEKSRKMPVKFEVILVQPGISKASLTSSAAKLLGTTELFLKRTTEASFRVVTSE